MHNQNPEQKDTNTLLIQMAADKQEKLDRINKASLMSTTYNTAKGGVMGALGGFISTVTSIMKRDSLNPNIIGENKDFWAVINSKPILNDLSAGAGPVVRNIVKHPKITMVGAAVAGAGIGLLWQNHVNARKQREAAQDVENIQKIQKDWVSRTEVSAEEAVKSRAF